VDDLWLAHIFQCLLHSIQKEVPAKAFRQLSAEHVSGEQVHNRHQVEEFLLPRGIGDDGGGT